MKNKLLLTAFTAVACSQLAWAGAKHFAVLIPSDTEWQASVPMISTDGGKTGKPMLPDEWHCGWFYHDFAEGEATDSMLIYRDDDLNHEDMLGVHGNWETGATATPFPMNMLFQLSDSVFFVAEESLLENEDGIHYSEADIRYIDGTCSFVMAGIIYDTDANLHPAFSCYSEGGEGCQKGVQGVYSAVALSAINDCAGITTGVVESTLDATTKKPKLTASGKKCFIEEKFFNQLFNYTEGVNEKSCYDIPFYRSLDGKWEFDSDAYQSKGAKVLGGFYPVEVTDDATILVADPTQTPVAAARTKRDAEGPIFYGPSLRALDSAEGVPVIDVLCNGPAWSKGADCTGQFDSGDVTTTFVQTVLGLDTGYRATDLPQNCVFGWSCAFRDNAPEGWIFYKDGTETPASAEMGYPRWLSKAKDANGGRNQHYCMESHTKFTYKPGLKFSFRGSDDLWVYVDNKIAVDLGGTHLPAPAYVDLDNFQGTSGKLTVGNEYDLDIFFCDRRTTMNSLRIKTNAFPKQATAINVKGTKDASNPAATTYEICYVMSDNGSCASALLTEGKESVFCGAHIIEAGIPVSYTLVQGTSASSPAVEGMKDITAAQVYAGGLDLTNLAAPKLDLSKLTFADGRYTLFVNINGRSAKVASFRTGGGDDAIKARSVVANSFKAFAQGNSIAIAANNGSASKYAILNTLGAVVRSGNLHQGHAVESALSRGSYIVKVGATTRLVNVR